FGLHVSPDLDTVMYTLGGGIDEEQGWGRDGDTYTVLAELSAYGAGPDWFGLGDRDIATHLLRTSMLGDGLPLSAATGVPGRRWRRRVRCRRRRPLWSGPARRLAGGRARQGDGGRARTGRHRGPGGPALHDRPARRHGDRPRRA